MIKKMLKYFTNFKRNNVPDLFSEFDKEVTSEFFFRLLRYVPFKDRKKVAEQKITAYNNSLEKYNLNFSNLSESKLKNPDNKSLKKLQDDGYVSLGSVLNSSQTKEVVEYFCAKKGYPSHVTTSNLEQDLRPDFHNVLKEKGNFFCSYTLEDSINAPHLLQLFQDPKILKIASHYLGCLPTVYSINTWWSFSNENKKAQATQLFHRDPDDFKFIAFFVYLTNVEKGNGSHEILKKSHDYDRFLKDLNKVIIRDKLKPNFKDKFLKLSLENDGNKEELDDLIDKHFSSNIYDLNGKSGSGFLEDTYSLHRGLPYLKNDRLVVWCRYGVSINSENYLNGAKKRILNEKVINNKINKFLLRNFLKS